MLTLTSLQIARTAKTVFGHRERSAELLAKVGDERIGGEQAKAIQDDDAAVVDRGSGSGLGWVHDANHYLKNRTRTE